MKTRLSVPLLLCVLAVNAPLLAEKKSVDCNKGQSLNHALKNIGPDETLTFTGTCQESLTLAVSGVTILGEGNAVISGESSADVISINGLQRITLQDFTVQNGKNGIHASGGAAIALKNIGAQNNAQTGILVESSPSVSMSNVTSQNNHLHGIEIESGSSLTGDGNILVQGNSVFGFNLATSSSATLKSGTLTAQQNVLGIQISINSGFFLASPAAAVKALNNFTVGLTMVSGAHFFSFGGNVTTSGNGLDGIDLASRAGMDLDAGAQFISFNNGRDGLHVEELSFVNLFNNPQFSGAPGFTSMEVYGNAVNGVSLLTNSQMHMFFQAQVKSHNNSGKGILVDNGSSMVLINSAIQNNHPDVSFFFGSRGDVSSSTIGTYTCDATTLIRGAMGLTCPH